MSPCCLSLRRFDDIAPFWMMKLRQALLRPTQHGGREKGKDSGLSVSQSTCRSHLPSNEDKAGACASTLWLSFLPVLSILGGAKSHRFKFMTETMSPFLRLSISCSKKLVLTAGMKLYPPKRCHCWKSGSECFSWRTSRQEQYFVRLRSVASAVEISLDCWKLL